MLFKSFYKTYIDLSTIDLPFIVRVKYIYENQSKYIK